MSKILKQYIPYKTSLREVARLCETNHHMVKRVLIRNGIKIVKAKHNPLTDKHKRRISNSCKGRNGWNKGKRMSKDSIYKNMAAHLRFNVEIKWIQQFENIEKLKCLNDCITNRSGRFDVCNEWYIGYIEKFYNDNQFNKIYQRWIKNNKEKYRKPSIDHITPKSKGGKNDLDNIQFLTWFENKCKSDMTQDDWIKMKSNLEDFFVW